MRIALVVGDFNPKYSDKMIESAKKTAEENKITISKIARVAGAFDTVLLTKKMLEKKPIDAVAVLGAVLQGKTSHDEAIVYSITPKLIDLSLEFNKPVSLGIIGPRVSKKDAEDRLEEYAKRAVLALVTSQKELRKAGLTKFV